MKKLKSITVFLLTIALTLLMAACSGAKLEAPTNFDIDDNYTLSWSAVADARTYQVEIRNAANQEIVADANLRRTTYDLSGLEEGDYEIRVMAIGGSNNDSLSEWSEVLNFHKAYESGMIYRLITNNTEYSVYRVGSASGDVEIEEFYRGKPVTQIEEKAFRSSKIQSIKIGNRVRSIGDNAFYSCSKLVSVEIPDTVTSIGNALFQQCTLLENVNIPTGIEYIPDFTFAYCRALKNIEIGDNITIIGSSAFSNCSSLESVVIPDSVTLVGSQAFLQASALESVEIGRGVNRINTYAFSQCTSLTDVHFVSDQQDITIEQEAFYGCSSLESIRLPEGITSIGNSVFSKCEALREVNIPDSVTHIGISAFADTAIYKSQETEGDHPGYIYVDDWLVSVSTAVKDTIEEILPTDFRENVVGIADYVFSGNLGLTCRNLVSVELPRSVKYLGNNAFYSCISLTKFITNDNSLEHVGDQAFAYCAILNNVQFGRGLKEIGSYAFLGDTQLDNNAFADTLVPETVERIGPYAFYGTALYAKPDEYGIIYAGKWVVGFAEDYMRSSTVELLEGTNGIADYAFIACSAMQNLNGLNQVQYIGEGAFYQCAQLSLVSLNRNLRRIERSTFYGCHGLFEINLPARCETIGDYAFAYCDRLSGLDISATEIASIGSNAFYGCANLRSLNLGEKITEISSYAFYLCETLQSLTIPDSITEIADRSFTRCTYLTDLTIGTGVTKIGEFAFRNCVSLLKVVIPGNVKEVGDYAFYDCTSVEELVIEEGVEEIGEYAFSGLEHYRQLILPTSLKTIGKYAFKNGYSLTSLVLQGSIENIGINAFYGNRMMTVYTDAVKGEPIGWSGSWNSSYRPVLWECTLSEDKSYVVSVTIGDLSNPMAHGGISAPVRVGYAFKGWATVSGGEAEYEAFELRYMEPGTTLYAVWVEAISG